MSPEIFAYLCELCPLTSAIESAKLLTIKITAAEPGGGKELIMANSIISRLNTRSVMGSSYYAYFMARFFAGLFAVPVLPSLSGS